MMLEIVFAVLFAASFVLNIILIWYSRKILSAFTLAGQVSIEFFSRISGYLQHLESVYQMQVFHGDKTIRSLIRHTKEISDYLRAHTEITSFTQPDLLESLEKIQSQEETETDGYKEK